MATLKDLVDSNHRIADQALVLNQNVDRLVKSLEKFQQLFERLAVSTDELLNRQETSIKELEDLIAVLKAKNPSP